MTEPPKPPDPAEPIRHVYDQGIENCPACRAKTAAWRAEDEQNAPRPQS